MTSVLTTEDIDFRSFGDDLNNQDLVRRSLSAYFRSEKKEGGGVSYDMPANCSGCMAIADKLYVVLENANGILAVYRVRNDGMLKRMKRWPKELDENTQAHQRGLA